MADAVKKLKNEIRMRVWRLLEERGIARFPRPVYGRIPNFKGAEEAARRLASAREFMRADLIKVNPDSPQRPIRRLALRQGKMLLMATPRLRRGFILLDPSRIPVRLHDAASTIKGAFKLGRILSTSAELRRLQEIDLMVTGCVAVSPRHGERLGKGGGYAELEYGILKEIGLLREGTPIATTIHEAQLVDHIPFEPHDLSLDIIATPRRLIYVENPAPRPQGIYWKLLDREKLESIPLLKELYRR